MDVQATFAIKPSNADGLGALNDAEQLQQQHKDLHAKILSRGEQRRKNEGERDKLLEEFLTTEKTYGSHLQSLLRGFIHRLQKHEELKRPLVSQDECSKIFQNVAGMRAWLL
jgi:hypothetical protein